MKTRFSLSSLLLLSPATLLVLNGQTTPIVVTAQSPSEFAADYTTQVLGALTNDKDNAGEEERRLIGGIFGANKDHENAPTGVRCGPLSGYTCAEGLECSRVGLSKRCTPRRDCIRNALKEFRQSFDSDTYKQMLFKEANTTEVEILEARDSADSNEELIQSRPMQSFIRAMRENPGKFAELGAAVQECSRAENEDDIIVTMDADTEEAQEKQGKEEKDAQHNRRYLKKNVGTSATALLEDEELSPSAAPNARFINFPTPSCAKDVLECEDGTKLQRIPPQCDFPSCPRPTCNNDWLSCPGGFRFPRDPHHNCEFPSCGDDSDNADDSDTDTGDAADQAPTAPDTTTSTAPAPTPSPTAAPTRTTYFGIQLEGGAAAGGALALFWEEGEAAITYFRTCLGAELGAGGGLNFLTIISNSGTASDITCNSALLDIDIALALSFGFGVGFCLDGNTDTSYLDITAGLGAAFGVGASACNVQTFSL